MNDLERRLERAEALNHRWNKAIAGTGVLVGSEYIDEPETVARRLRQLSDDKWAAQKENVRLRKTVERV